MNNLSNLKKLQADKDETDEGKEVHFKIYKDLYGFYQYLHYAVSKIAG